MRVEIKWWYVIVALAVGLGAGFALYPLLLKPKPIVVEKEGKIIEKQVVVQVPKMGTNNCERDFNELLAEYTDWLSSKPIVDEVTKNAIRFHIKKNRYELAYSSSDIPRLHFSPVLMYNIRIPTLVQQVGGGCLVDYANIGAGAIVATSIPLGDMSLSAVVYIRF